MPLRQKKNAKDQSILHALLPGARLQKHTKKILVHTATSNETIRFNIGGTVFETFKATLRSIPNCRLASDAFLSTHYRHEEQDYFFDRDPEIFLCVLNYLRSGELHLPTSVCGPVVKSELEFWGIEETDIEECCWSRYSSWAKALQELRKLEADRKKSMMQWELPVLPQSNRGWKGFKNYAWNFFNNPSSSPGAQLYGYFAMVLISVSIFCFCARTHIDFKVEQTVLIPKIGASSLDANANVVLPLNLSEERLEFQRPNISLTQETTLSSFSRPPSFNMVSEQDNQEASQNMSSSPLQNHTHAFYEETTLVPHPILQYVDASCFVFFAIELVVRFLVCPRKLQFLLTSMTLVEILALLPDIIKLIAKAAGTTHISGAIDLMELFRVLRIFRLMRQMPGLWILVYTLRSSMKDLLLLLLFLCTGTLMFSTLVYFAENEVAGGSFSSIPKCFWWSVITMTTVGYGDMFPVTRTGYLIGTVTAISGLLMVGFTVPVLVNNFVLYYNHTESHIEREKQREKSMKRSNIHLLSNAAAELQQSGRGSGRQRMKLDFSRLMRTMSEEEEEYTGQCEESGGSDDVKNTENNNRNGTDSVYTEGVDGQKDNCEKNGHDIDAFIKGPSDTTVL